jgi:uncharacterized protein YjeT (DUF2065 family)
MRVAFTAIGLMLIWQGLALSLFIKASRRGWAHLEKRTDADLRHVGVTLFLLGGLIILVCVG